MTERILVAPADLFGDGVFETIHLRVSGPWLLEEHLARLERSAELLDLPPPPLEGVRSKISYLSGGERALRVIYTRSGLIHVSLSEISATVLRERRDGVRVLTAGLGVSVTNTPPWSLAAAKSLSYASNFAARRWAARHQAEDLIWLSTEGYVLEAPTASVVWLSGGVLHTVPPTQAEILPGITAAHLLATAGNVGLETAERMVTLPELAAAEAIWLASSLRGLAEVTSLDGVGRTRSPWTARLLKLLGFA